MSNHTVEPGPGNPATGANYANSPDVLSTGVNGVGQQIALIQTSPTTAGLSLCSGTLINPRTVITAAHCLYNNPAYFYGSETGAGGGLTGPIGDAFGHTNGIPLSFGFSDTNRCLGVAVNGCAVGSGPYEVWRDSGFQTQTDLYIYNANQVWYNRNAQPVALGGGGEFANGDIALVTLDTHAHGIPTWALLFSPLEEATHATITGYGGAGVGLAGIGNLAGIDYRRRAAENMIDALVTNHDWRFHLTGSTASITNNHPIYWMDFDDPDFDPNNLPANFFNNTAPAGQRNNGYYDFNGFGGTALPNEGATAGGDSGGPLIVDQRWDIPVVAGVLTGSWSFNGGISTYGQFNVYPPLFPFWEEIVQNNPYVYASAKAGNGNWFDPNHWVQDMDPNFMVIGPDGELVNALPSGPQGGSDMDVDKFGTLCFLGTDCMTFDGPPNPDWGGTSYVTAGGPGSTNFVPNNVEPVNSADPNLHVRARYYDVTLREAGRTTLDAAATIDVMTIANPLAHLHVTGTGTLSTWADYTQVVGWTNVDGRINTNEMLIVGGLLSGSGLIDPGYLTVVAAGVAPGSIQPSGASLIGTLTVQGDVILSSASTLFIELNKQQSDRLAVLGDADNTGMLALNGGSVWFSAGKGSAPRHNQSFTFITAEGGVDGTFGAIQNSLGVLQPNVTYHPNSVVVSLQAGSLAAHLGTANSSAMAFANALDALRGSSYNNLWNLYGSIDLMSSSQLSVTLSGLTPRVIGDAGALHDRQSKLLMTTVTDRLSLLGSGRATGLTMVGSPMAAFAAQSGTGAAPSLGFGASNGGGAVVGELPGRLTGFVSGGVERTRATYGEKANAGQGGWHVAMGLETPLGDKGTLGTAVGFAEGESLPGGDRNSSRTTLAAAYASMPLGGGFYVGGVLAAETARTSVERLSTDGSALLRLSGATSASRYSAVAEAGVVKDIGRGLTLTPRAQLGYGRYTLDGFRETGGETALRLDDLTVSRVEARFGAKLEGATTIAGLAIKPQISADYVNLLSGRNTGATVRFAAAPDVAFALPLATSDAGWAEVKGGVTIGDGPVTFGLSGQHSVGGNLMADDRAQVDLRFRF